MVTSTLAAPLYTVGYGTRTLEEFLAVLRAHALECVVDVRTSPYSKFKPEFSKEPLELVLRQHGIRYVFMGDSLGGQPKDPACQTDGKIDYDKVRTQPFFQAGLERLRGVGAERGRVVLLCSEGRPEQCHRSKLIGEALAAVGVCVQHIDEDGRLLTQTQAIDRLTQGQLDLFGPPSFTSRKRYPRGSSADDQRPA
ncbi:MAG: DUF488 domain-containing protein [Verrucomicrobia bacterium]|nr:DUF488 domain-containing protein [Verrucomicrobiota bacterium]